MKWLVLWLYAFFFLIAMGLASADPEGWMNDIRITITSSSSEYPSLATDTSGNVHIAWVDDRDGYPFGEIYYKKLNNNSVPLLPAFL